ncbi:MULTISPECIES: phosphatidate cytidylyltransferase [unclassified Paracoccus (in: a-proteobacteria)]|uniref:phosphatidate cytidylyltransferase n=1 Tax=unclassified Paracoccus (in: a-proteobacteria) TaxID=2688777 RepID=UPI001600A63B|nr:MULTISPECIES: phosphatidate cytidylyltransferase [unclassified Paracoccus (in: a-proteobacteria)]MBB1491403.1 CDP-archaeol synthase [Paracoccus sp. MC1854]MBB1499517.1 CDP-archaeol synthase [Paracoccus sp. MC1862]QQO46114.1 CDP-archaeol synthase [Paracoccus sp. MC1862]
MRGLRPPRVAPQGRWPDLAERLGSALIILVAGTALLLLPVLVASIGISVLFAALMWELTRLVVPAPQRGRVIGVGLLSGLAMALTLLWGSWGALAFILSLGLGTRIARRELRLAYVGFSLMMVLAAWGLLWIRITFGLGEAVWIVALVVLSDVLGYFVGRSVGGPKFWPAISPKKTWSGTVAGWAGAVLLGIILVILGRADPGVIVIGPLLAFAGQMGDIAESWIKRRVGVKDSSRLIPGHGGLMDRFDAMAGSLAAATVLGLGNWLPIVG